MPCAYSGTSVTRFLEQIPNTGTPAKVTQVYLQSIGFKSSNDKYLIGVFKALGFIDGSAVPTDTWKAYRDKQRNREILGQAVTRCYSSLFETFPDANARSDDEIANWIRSNTNYSPEVVGRAVRTFKALCAASAFNGAVPPVESLSQSTNSTAPPTLNGSVVAVTSRPSISINIQLQIPESNNPDVYEHFFAAMHKYLINEN